MSGQSIGSLAAAGPTTNTPEVRPSVAAPHQDVSGSRSEETPPLAGPHQGVPGSRSGSNTSARHQDVKLMHNYAIVINRSKLKFIFTLAILHSVLGLHAQWFRRLTFAGLSLFRNTEDEAG